MSSIFDMLYHEYCRARLAEMRKQLLIPLVGEVLQTPPDGGDRSEPRDWPAKAPPTIG